MMMLKRGLTSDDMVDVSRTSSCPPALEVVVVSGKIKIYVVGIHSWQNLLPHGLVTTVATPRVAGIVSKDNLPLIFSRCGQFSIKELFHGSSVILVFVNGDCVH